MTGILATRKASALEVVNLPQHGMLTRPLKVTILGNSHSATIPGIFDRFCAAMGGSVIRHVNAGIGGNTTAQIYARINIDVPNDTDICLVIEGTNDGNAFANSTLTLAQHVTNMTSIFSNLKSRGMRPVLILCPGSNAPNNTYAHLQMRLTDLLLARKLGIPVYDPYRSIMKDTNGEFTAGTFTTDGMHALDSATVTVANQLVTDIDNNRCASLVPVCNDDRGVHAVGSVRNSLLLTDSNADGLADNWTKSTAGTATLTSASGDGLGGNWQTITASSITENSWLQIRPNLTRTSPGTDEVILLFAAKYTATTNCTLQLYVEWYAPNDSTLVSSVNLLPVTTSSIAPYRTQRLLKVPNGASKARFSALMIPSNGSNPYTGSVSIAEFRMISVGASLGEF